MHPIVQRLTPPPGEQAPPAWMSALRLALARGLPSPLDLPGLAWNVMLAAPSARVQHWLNLPPDAVVAQGSVQSQPLAAALDGADARDTLAPALVFTQGRRLMARLPLRLHTSVLLPRSGAGTALPGRMALEIQVLGFCLTAGALTGAAPGASFVELALRRIDRGTDVFMPPVARPALRQRLVATTGLGAERGKRWLDAAPVSTGSDDPATRALRGGLQWRLTHG